MTRAGDIALVQQDDFSYDLEIENNDLVGDDGLQTAVVISLFTDARCNEDELPAEDSSRRGWWGDMFPTADGDQIGSKLWLLKREKRTRDVLNRAEEYCNEALAWMLEDGIAESVVTAASYDPSGTMLLAVSIQRPDANEKTFRFKVKWDAEANRS